MKISGARCSLSGMAAALTLLLPACAVGPNYHRPDAPVPTAYKELPPEIAVWTPSSPRDGADRGVWWSDFQ
jgi:outer membrane protein TolC